MRKEQLLVDWLSKTVDFTAFTRMTCLLVCFCVCICGSAQTGDDAYNNPVSLPGKIFRVIDERANTYQQGLLTQTDKYISRLAKQEKKLQRKLWKKDTIAAKALFGNPDSVYQNLQQKLKSPVTSVTSRNLAYNSHLDSMQTGLRFLSQQLGPANPSMAENIKGSLEKYGQLQHTLNTTDAIEKFLQQRQQMLQEQLPLDFAKQLNSFKKDIYYYRQTLNNYRNVFNEPDKLEALLMQGLKKIPAFNKFFNYDSQLAGLFRLSDDQRNIASLAGLQSRSQLQQDLQQRLGSAPTSSQLQQQVSEGQTQLNQLRDALNKKGGDAGEIPGFKPNSQKTKSFLHRLEYGSNVQSTRANNFFPATTDIGLSIGYKVSDKSTIGIGGSYKLGWGNGIQHINLSHQGIGARSFVDIKLKGSLWVSGGGEMNYRSQFRDFSILNDYSSWQRSLLLGLEKKFSLGKKMKANMHLLYDFLYKQQVPQTQALLFRVGYAF